MPTVPTPARRPRRRPTRATVAIGALVLLPWLAAAGLAVTTDDHPHPRTVGAVTAPVPALALLTADDQPTPVAPVVAPVAEPTEPTTEPTQPTVACDTDEPTVSPLGPDGAPVVGAAVGGPGPVRCWVVAPG